MSKDKKGYCVFPETGQDVQDCEKEQLIHIVGNNNFVSYAVLNTKDFPTHQTISSTPKTSKICYDVGDDCVFEITKGKKKWTIPLDDFFDKVIKICAENKE